jgi:GNAT superfamily N-acetyltransferase
MVPERATIDDLVTVVERQSDFWGEREMAPLHHPMLIHEFGETALVMRDDDRRVIAYLFGFVTLAGVGYVHLVSVCAEHRRQALGRRLYEAFEGLARERGAVALKAFTQPHNKRSIAFHSSLGFSVTEVADYVGEGQARTVFWRELSPAAA